MEISQNQFIHTETRIDNPGMTQGLPSKTGMGYRGNKGNRDDLARAQGCTHGVY